MKWKRVRAIINKKTGNVTFDWYYPEMETMVCNLCPEKGVCKHKDDPDPNFFTCQKIFPYCG